MTLPAIAELVRAVELLALLAMAVSGIVEARNRQMDIVGLSTVAFVSAFGGGTLRDLLLDRRPFYWVEHWEYVALILALTLAARPLSRLVTQTASARVLIVADAIGLGLFSATGVALALAAGMPWLIAAMLGVITGVFGGILRDVLLNEVPMVLRDGQPYALAAFAGCWLYLLLHSVGAAPTVALWTSAALTIGIRLIAWRQNWTLK